ncbi:MAG: hypothetical protein IPF99_30075 [Deltaproteobacteria bacterium]|jgi:hypothetical protein|nr:hypothetical protein [Deltaproteobacteria bacterium]
MRVKLADSSALRVEVAVLAPRGPFPGTLRYSASFSRHTALTRSWLRLGGLA